MHASPVHGNSFLSERELVLVGGAVRAFALNGTPVSCAFLQTIIHIVTTKKCSRQTVRNLPMRFPQFLGKGHVTVHIKGTLRDARDRRI